MEDDKPTELTREDMDKLAHWLMHGELHSIECMNCGKKHFPSYGSAFGECDECWFSRFPKEQVREFYKQFF